MLLRLLRLMRVLKLARAFPRLATIVKALLKGVSSIGYVGVIMVVTFYVFAIVGVILFADADPWHFGTLHTALITLFRSATLDGWYEVLSVSMFGCDTGVDIYSLKPEICTNPKKLPVMATLYTLIFLVVSANILLVLFIGIVATSMDEARESNEIKELLLEEMEQMEEDFGITMKQLGAFKQIFHMIDQEGDGLLTHAEIEMAMDLLKLDVTPAEMRRLYVMLDPSMQGMHCANFVRLILMTPKFLKLSTSRRALMKLRKDEARFEHKMKRHPFGLFILFWRKCFRSDRALQEKAAIMLQRNWRRRQLDKKFRQEVQLAVNEEHHNHDVVDAK